MSTDPSKGLADLIKPQHRSLIEILDQCIPPVVIRAPGDVANRDQLMYDAGRRSVVDDLLSILQKITTED